MIAIELAEYLDAQTAHAWKPADVGGSIFVGVYPPKPDNLLAIQVSGVSPEGLTPYDRVRLQILSRTVGGLDTAHAQALQVYNLLHGFRNGRLKAGGSWIVSILAVDGPAHIGQDENRRHEYSMNFEALVYNPASNRRE